MTRMRMTTKRKMKTQETKRKRVQKNTIQQLEPPACVGFPKSVRPPLPTVLMGNADKSVNADLNMHAFD
jgi:hypothetical protein